MRDMNKIYSYNNKQMAQKTSKEQLNNILKEESWCNNIIIFS